MKKTTSVSNFETLNSFLLETLNGIRSKKISIEEAQAISQVSDKIIKNNLTMIIESKRVGDETPIDFFKSTKKIR